MMCRLVHCASYHTIKEIENKMTIEARKSMKATPFGMSLNVNAATDVPWATLIGSWKPKILRTCYMTPMV